MIDPQTVLLATPTYDGKLDAHYVAGLMQSAALQMFHTNYFLCCESCIPLARNRIAHHFMQKTKYQHLLMIDADVGFSYQDLALLLEGDELAVVGEYARKEPQRRPVKFGLGFARVSREVFEKLGTLTNEDGSERLGRYFENGEQCIDYHITGATGDGRYVTEDRGFWELVKLAEIKIRVETRTKLVHWGKSAYPYLRGEDYFAQ